MSAIPEPDPPLADGVVVLRPWQPDDAEVLAAAWRDPEVARWCAVPDDRSPVAAGRWIEGADGCRRSGTALDLAVVRAGKEPGEVAGEVGLGPIQWAHRRAAIGFWVLGPHRGAGLATRAVRLLAGWALATLPLDVIAAEVATANRASVGVLRRAGFTLAAERDDRQAWVRP